MKLPVVCCPCLPRLPSLLNSESTSPLQTLRSSYLMRMSRRTLGLGVSNLIKFHDHKTLSFHCHYWGYSFLRTPCDFLVLHTGIHDVLLKFRLAIYTKVQIQRHQCRTFRTVFHLPYTKPCSKTPFIDCFKHISFNYVAQARTAISITVKQILICTRVVERLSFALSEYRILLNILRSSRPSWSDHKLRFSRSTRR